MAPRSTPARPFSGMKGCRFFKSKAVRAVDIMKMIKKTFASRAKPAF